MPGRRIVNILQNYIPDVISHPFNLGLCGKLPGGVYLSQKIFQEKFLPDDGQYLKYYPKLVKNVGKSLKNKEARDLFNDLAQQAIEAEVAIHNEYLKGTQGSSSSTVANAALKDGVEGIASGSLNKAKVNYQEGTTLLEYIFSSREKGEAGRDVEVFLKEPICPHSESLDIFHREILNWYEKDKSSFIPLVKPRTGFFDSHDANDYQDVKNLVLRKYLIHLGSQKTLHTAIASLLPCLYFYKELGINMKDFITDDNPYKEWVNSYSDPAFVQATDKLIILAEAMVEKLSDKEFKEVEQAIKLSANFELDFWNDVMGYELKFTCSKDINSCKI